MTRLVTTVGRSGGVAAGIEETAIEEVEETGIEEVEIEGTSEESMVVVLEAVTRCCGRTVGRVLVV